MMSLHELVIFNAELLALQAVFPRISMPGDCHLRFSIDFTVEFVSLLLYAYEPAQNFGPLACAVMIVGSHSDFVFDGFNLMRVSINSDLFLTCPRISNASPETLIVIGCERPVAGRPVPNAVPGVCCLSFIYKNITL